MSFIHSFTKVNHTPEHMVSTKGGKKERNTR